MAKEKIKHITVTEALEVVKESSYGEISRTVLKKY